MHACLHALRSHLADPLSCSSDLYCAGLKLCWLSYGVDVSVCSGRQASLVSVTSAPRFPGARARRARSFAAPSGTCARVCYSPLRCGANCKASLSSSRRRAKHRTAERSCSKWCSGSDPARIREDASTCAPMSLTTREEQCVVMAMFSLAPASPFQLAM